MLVLPLNLMELIIELIPLISLYVLTAFKLMPHINGIFVATAKIKFNYKSLDVIYDHFDFVQGSRYMPGGDKVEIPLFRWITTGIYSLLFKLIVRFPITDGTNGFRAFSLSIFKNKNLNIWQSWLNRYELEPYLYYKVIENDFKITEAPVTKFYPKGNSEFTKMEPFVSWWSILRPIILLKLKIKR